MSEKTLRFRSECGAVVSPAATVDRVAVAKKSAAVGAKSRRHCSNTRLHLSVRQIHIFPDIVL